MKLGSVVNILQTIAPLEMSEGWDNSGLLIGDNDSDITNILITLDITIDVVDQAIENNIDLIISHHPILFSPVNKILYDDYEGYLIKKLIENKINVFAMHTNMDISEHGMNYDIARKLGLNNIKGLKRTEEGYFIGVYGNMADPVNIIEFNEILKEILDSQFVKYVGDDDDIAKTVAICSGSGDDLIDTCIEKGIDLYITSDIKYHIAQKAYYSGLNIIDVGHFESEIIFKELLKEKLILHNIDCNIFFSEESNVFKLG